MQCHNTLIDKVNVFFCALANAKSVENMAPLEIKSESMHAIKFDKAIHPFCEFRTAFLINWFLIAYQFELSKVTSKDDVKTAVWHSEILLEKS